MKNALKALIIANAVFSGVHLDDPRKKNKPLPFHKRFHKNKIKQNIRKK